MFGLFLSPDEKLLKAMPRASSGWRRSLLSWTGWVTAKEAGDELRPLLAATTRFPARTLEREFLVAFALADHCVRSFAAAGCAQARLHDEHALLSTLAPVLRGDAALKAEQVARGVAGVVTDSDRRVRELASMSPLDAAAHALADVGSHRFIESMGGGLLATEEDRQRARRLKLRPLVEANAAIEDRRRHFSAVWEASLTRAERARMSGATLEMAESHHMAEVAAALSATAAAAGACVVARIAYAVDDDILKHLGRFVGDCTTTMASLTYVTTMGGTPAKKSVVDLGWLLVAAELRAMGLN